MKMKNSSFSSPPQRCSAAPAEALKQGQQMIEAGNEEQGLMRLEEALKHNPNDTELRNYYLRHRAVAVQRFLQAGDNARAGQLDAAETAYQKAQRFDADNANVKAGLAAVARERVPPASVVREAEEAYKRGELTALNKAKEVLQANPTQRDARAIARRSKKQKVKPSRRARSSPPRSRTRSPSSCATRRCARCSSCCRRKAASTSSTTATCRPICGSPCS